MSAGTGARGPERAVGRKDVGPASDLLSKQHSSVDEQMERPAIR